MPAAVGFSIAISLQEEKDHAKNIIELTRYWLAVRL